MLQQLLNAITLGSIYYLFAVGMSLVWGSVGILNFAHGAIFMFATFTSFLVVSVVRLPLVAVLAISIVVGAVLGLLCQQLAFGPILRRNADVRSAELQIIVAGIGIATVPVAIAQKQHNEPFGLGASGFEVMTYDWGPLRPSNIGLIIVLAAALLGGGVALWLRRSIHGLALRTIGVDSETTALMGINRRRMNRLLVAVSGGLAGLAGALLTYYLGAIEPTSGDPLLIKAFAIIVLGGVGSMLGAVVGALVLAVAETAVLSYSSGTWVDAVSFGLIFLILLVRPSGLFGRAEVRRT